MKLVWKRSSAGNPMLSYWALKAIVFPSRSGYNFNILGLVAGIAWGPGFHDEDSARTAAEAAFLEHKQAHDWQTPGREALEKRLAAEYTGPHPRSRREYEIHGDARRDQPRQGRRPG
jgi:hypothetical protein